MRKIIIISIFIIAIYIYIINEAKELQTALLEKQPLIINY